MDGTGGGLVVWNRRGTTSQVLSQADNDAHLIALWLCGRSRATQSAYKWNIRAFLAHAGGPLQMVTLGAIQSWADSLRALKPASRARKLASLRALLSFGHRLGYLPLNVGAAIRLPSIKNELAERILSETDVHRMLAREPSARNAAMMTLLYSGGLRVSEVTGLRWRDMQPCDDAGQVTVFEKGGKTRAILLPSSLWRMLMALRGEGNANLPVFRSQRGGHLTRIGVHIVIKAAAQRAGLSDAVSAHWLRRADVSYALDRGAPAHLVQQTVGRASLETTSGYAHARTGGSSARYLGL